MPVEIYGKILRNIPEQVAKNAEDIKDLKEQQYQIFSAEVVSGHLILHLYNGEDVDAGVVKGISYMDINGSQHLIAHYNDGTTEDLGAIFQGNVNISGNLTADSIIENMSGYSFSPRTLANVNITNVYCGIVKNGNKLTVVQFFKIERTGSASYGAVGEFNIPSEVANKLYPTQIGVVTNALSSKIVSFFKDPQTTVELKTIVIKGTNLFQNFLYGLGNLELNVEYQCRLETTFLLSDNLAS